MTEKGVSTMPPANLQHIRSSPTDGPSTQLETGGAPTEIPQPNVGSSYMHSSMTEKGVSTVPPVELLRIRSAPAGGPSMQPETPRPLSARLMNVWSALTAVNALSSATTTD